PFTDPEQALDVVLGAIPQAPIWPQLPKSSLFEQMETQYVEGMPRAVIDEDKRRLYFDTSGDSSEELAEFYEQYILAMDPDEGTGDCSAMAISEKHAKGLHALKARLDQNSEKLPFVKVHTTGPVSFTLSSVDETKRPLYYNEEFRDMVTKALAMKCRWQLQFFKPCANDFICFIDEPILSAFGSSTYVSVTREDVVAMINEQVEAIHAEGALAGIHCCGGTEWSICVDAGADIVNFDAFGYGETVALYPESINELLDREGYLAFGIAPSSAEVRDTDASRLLDHYEALLAGMQAAGIDRDKVLERTILTSSCGTGSLEEQDASRVFSLLAEFPEAWKARYGAGE
ncbi:MAG: hypothetical protein ACOCVM_09615, partial [Desulfovibrionaceae bacterium]